MRQRYAARVLVLDEQERVLLLWHALAGEDEHWSPPGGGLEGGETSLEAAHRELREEVGLEDAPLSGPLYRWRHYVKLADEVIEQHEDLFVARTTGWSPCISPAVREHEEILTWRWCSPEDVAELEGEVWPHGLADLLRAAGDSLGQPRDLGLTNQPPRVNPA